MADEKLEAVPEERPKKETRKPVHVERAETKAAALTDDELAERDDLVRYMMEKRREGMIVTDGHRRHEIDQLLKRLDQLVLR